MNDSEWRVPKQEFREAQLRLLREQDEGAAGVSFPWLEDVNRQNALNAARALEEEQ